MTPSHMGREQKPQRGFLQTIEEGRCCTPAFQKAAQNGALDEAMDWTCPKCGVEYKPTVINGAVRHWTAQVYSILVRPRA